MPYILKMSFELKADNKKLEKFLEIMNIFAKNSENEVISGEFEIIEIE